MRRRLRNWRRVFGKRRSSVLLVSAVLVAAVAAVAAGAESEHLLFFAPLPVREAYQATNSETAAPALTGQHSGLPRGRGRTRPSQALPGIIADAGGRATAVWTATGLGPKLVGIWMALAPYPPFSLVQWVALKIWALPGFWRVYMIYTLADKLAGFLIPGLYAQIFTGTWLSALSVVSPHFYKRSVLQRLQELLQKQARLRRVPGQPTPQLSKETMDAVETQLKDDDILCEALGSMPVLGMWHKLEKTRLDDDSLLAKVPAESQLRWVIEALRAGYLNDLETAAAETRLAKAAEDAEKALKTLRDAVDSAAFRARYGIVEVGVEAKNTLSGVEAASTASQTALQALEEAKKTAGRFARLSDDPLGRTAWSAKVGELIGTYSDSPAIAAELFKLRAVAETPSAGATSEPAEPSA